MNNTSVDSYLAEGCGRCEKFQTPDCKVHPWQETLVALRALLAETPLNEEMKWGSPCYTLGGKNVVMISARNDYCALSFLKGALLADPDGLLVPPGPHCQAARLLKFTSAGEVDARRASAAAFIAAAIANERAGKKVAFKQTLDPLPDELEAMLDAQPEVRAAFDALTRGRKRSYLLYVGGAKQAKTRAARAARSIPKILAGKGFNER